MKRTVSKWISILCAFGMMLAVSVGIIPMQAQAASAGRYFAEATPHYRHPGTGKIEDSGGENAIVMGQGMTESATGTKALIEVDEKGQTYIIFRLKLTNFTGENKFWIDADGDGTYQEADAVVVANDRAKNGTTDYKVAVPHENVVIRSAMNVIPMGRDVVWFITFGKLTPTDATAIPPEEKETPVPKPETSKEPDSSEPASEAETSKEPVSGSENSSKPISEAASGAPVSEDVSQESFVSGEEVSSSVPEMSDSEESSEALGLEEFDAAGNEVSQKKPPAEHKEIPTAVWVVFGCVLAAGAIGFAIYYFCFFRRKK